MKRITRTIRWDKEFRAAMLALDEQTGAAKPLPISVSGLSDGARDAFLAECLGRADAQGAQAVFVHDEAEAVAVTAMLQREGIAALRFPQRDFVFLNISSSHDTERERLSVLCRLLTGERVTVVTTPYAALQRTIPPSFLNERFCRLRATEQISPAALAARLVKLGFVRVDLVEGVGQFALRGGIFDLYPAASDAPVRLEFFGDEIDRMAYFDPMTQRVSDACEEILLSPARETVIDAEGRQRVSEAHRALMRASGDPETVSELAAECALLVGEGDVPFADRYMDLLYGEDATLLSYFGERTVCAVLTQSGTRERTEELLRALAEEGTALAERGLLSPRYSRFVSPYGEYETFLSRSLPLYVSSFGNSYNGRMGGLFGFRARRTVSYFGKESLLFEDVAQLVRTGYRTLVLTETAAEADALTASLRDRDLDAHAVSPDGEDDALFTEGCVLVTHGVFSSGFELIVPRIALLSTLPDEGTLRRRERRARMGKRRPAGQKILSYADLSVGDYVVHAVHGIGVFEGMQQICTDGVTRDYITIRYAGSDSLFLPAERLEMIAKYIGARSEDGTVRLSKLGGGDWQRTKSRATAAAKDMARELVRLYAERQRREGFAFPPDSELEREFADAFEFEETEPQLAAIAEITADMARPVPMDRLLCGDVGFGKTEVALRAAFKAIVSGKQVAILVPTTILAMQHYQTALSRMRGHAVNVEMLSRLRTPKEQARIQRRLARGEIDLVIGTHSLLSKNISFRDLGLLIVDEEQRFGVGQKEKLKTLATDVDVLTLSATPIPRTLNMAMSGIRDMSVLDEAPADRHPVQTYVMEHSEPVIEEAVRRELARGGQVLYLYNRTESMERPYARLCRAFPDAHVAVAHGKMDKEELEDIWQALVRGDIDILICTTIVETGVDLPSANTLIIEDADRMGLSQLHQLRGRVGRSGRQAYAYFTYRRGKELSEIAEKRLRAIREYAAFGAGFKIALRDLEIRGAGNLLGAEQHGHIDAVGYDLYVKILSEAILEERGEARETPFESQIELSVNAYLPEGYVRRSADRMEMYKKISLISSEEDMRDVLDEFSDRYGEPPAPVLRLLRVALSRALASRARIGRVDAADGVLRFFAEQPDLSVWSLLFEENKSLRFTASARGPLVSYRLSHGEDVTEALCRLMTAYTKASENVNNS